MSNILLTASSQVEWFDSTPTVRQELSSLDAHSDPFIWVPTWKY